MDSIITLPAGPESELDWSALVHDLPVAEGRIFELQLFDQSQIDVHDEALFKAHELAVNHYTSLQLAAEGVLLFRQEGPFAEMVAWTPLMEEHFEEWAEELPGNRAWLRELFAADCFSQYVHRLIALLPDEQVAYGHVDLSYVTSPIRRAQLISKERFEYIELKQRKSASPVGLVLPSDLHLTEEVEEALDSLVEQHQDVRIIPEFFLTEEWDGLDQIIALTSALGPQGRRKLMGFCAAGGEVITYGEALALPIETHFPICSSKERV